jgi:type IV fimbrial biogenesis protein FimT
MSRYSQSVGKFYLFRIRQAGVSIVELLIGIALTMGLLLMALPSLRDSWQSAYVKKATEESWSGLNIARSEAIKSNIKTHFFLVSSLDSTCSLSSTGRFWVVSKDNPSGSCGSTTSNTLAPRISQSGKIFEAGNILLNGNSGAVSAYGVAFSGSGFVSVNADGSPPITLISVSSLKSSSVPMLALSLGAGGHIKICYPNKSSTDPQSCA